MIDYNRIGTNEKQKNILTILNYIVGQKEVFATDISAKTGLSFATISRALSLLKKSGIVVTKGKEMTDMGRHPDIFSLNGSFGYLLHFYMDAEYVKGYLADFLGTVIAVKRMEIDRNITVNDFTKKLKICADTLTNLQRVKYEKVMAASIAIPGLVDEKNKIVKRIPNFSNFKNANLFQYAQDALKVPVIINNEARLCVVGEYIGGFQEKKNIVYIDFTKYSGIGAGIILDGHLLTGKNGFAGEVGDMLVDMRNLDNGYHEDEGSLEATAGVGVLFGKLELLMKRNRATILKEILTMQSAKVMDIGIVEQAVLMQDLDVMDVFDETMKMWAIAVINLSVTFDPDTLILGGVVNQSNDVVLARIKHYVSKVLPYDINIKLSEKNDDSQLCGGIYRLRRYVFNHMVTQRLFEEETE
ncbi:MAG: ROK family transcriptional regulator [Christensenellaceae bacterium]